MRRTGYASDNGISYILGDQLGSSSVIIGQSGAVQATNYYYPYGANRGNTFTDLTTKRFTGQYGASGLAGSEGLSYYGARWYDAQLGRFISADTEVPRAGDPQAFNRYAYARNSPLTRIDPSGQRDTCNPALYNCGPKYIPPSNFSCVAGYGCYDRKHLSYFPSEGGQKVLWEDFRVKASDASGKPFIYIIVAYPVGQGGIMGAVGGKLTIVYHIGGIDSSQYMATLMGIFLDFAKEYEGFQFINSGFANQDLPSDYVGMSAVMNGTNPDTMIEILATTTDQSVEYTNYESPGSGLFPQSMPWGNYDITPRVNKGSGWQNIAYPKEMSALLVSPSQSNWTRSSVMKTGIPTVYAAYDSNGHLIPNTYDR